MALIWFARLGRELVKTWLYSHVSYNCACDAFWLSFHSKYLDLNSRNQEECCSVSLHDDSQVSVTKVNPELNFFVCAGSFQFKFQARSCHSRPRPLLGYGRMLQRMRPQIHCDSESPPPLNLGSRGRCWSGYKYITCYIKNSDLSFFVLYKPFIWYHEWKFM